MNPLSRNQIIEPKVFESGSDDDPEEWLESFELLSKLNGWSEEDRMELVQLYLGRKEMSWYKKNIKYKRKILESGLKGWKSSIDKLKDTQRIVRLLEDDGGEGNIGSKLNESVSRKVVKIHPEIESGELMYEAMAKSFEKLSLNLISKIDDVAIKIEDRLKNSKSFSYNASELNKP
ncbi:hypothetical protein AYI70_g12218 [Smittium culicis]|uniref:Uncharacterized protein n=1 Tax=Smittium culicis TaxID=133412 RepID=A0A1R1WYI0_9FUNG|nr:hypothetical protein AYI70_g12218 [Smittium culicis]